MKELPVLRMYKTFLDMSTLKSRHMFQRDSILVLLIYRGLGDEHHAIHLFYGSKGNSFEEIRDFGFRITFHDTPEPSWEKISKTENDSFNTINNKTVVYYQHESLDKHSVVYRGEPQPASTTSSILELEEQEKILRSIINSIN